MRSCERMVMADDATRVSCTMQYCSESNIDGHEFNEDGDVKCLDVVLLPHVRKCRQNKSVCKRKRDIVVQQVVNKRISEVSRKKRSCLSRSARSSEWGLIWNVKEDAGMDRELDIDKIMFERLGKASGGCQSGKTNKDDENSGIFSSISGGLTTDMRLKIKVGGENLYYPNVLDSKSVYGLTSASNLGPGSGSQNLATHIGDKLFEEEAIGKFESDENYLYKLADVLSGQTDDLESTSLMERSDGKSEETCLLTPSKKLTDALMEPVNIESMDPGTGTSPDSEVIDSIPEAQVGEKQWEDLKNSDFGSSKELNFSVHDTASKSRRKKGKLACSRDGSVRDVSPGLKSHNVSKTKANASKTQRRKKTACKHGEKQGRSIIKGGIKGKSAPDKALCKTEDYLCEENDAVVKQKLDLGGKFNADEKEVPASLNMVPGSGLREQHSSPRKAWVCCDDCHKWRHIPASLADLIEETKCAWTCKDSDDKAYADCSIAQEKSNAEINVELGISDASDEEDNSEDSKYYKESEHQHPISSQESTFTHISANKFLHRCRKTQTIDEIMVCYCTPPLEGQLGCGDACLNRILNIECVQGGCPCGNRCSNQQFQKRNYAKLEWFKCGKKGYGLKASEDISEGQFLIEYVGEVLDVHTYWARQREYGLKGHRHFYFMSLNGSEVIDASAKGNLGRFVNHSCDPNCRTEKWMVNGEICIGLFALRDIKQDEELTFDYNYVRDFGAAAKKCYCGSPHCQGYIGGDPRNAEIINQDDSDEEFPEPVMLAEGDTEEGPVDHPDKENSLNPASASSQLHQINVSVKKGKVCANHTNNLEVTVTTNRLKVPSIKHKKAVEGSSNGHFETVEEKLKELIDPDGGISRSKDATKGYLKLLLLTVASGDWSNGQVIQSNRDLSMILGALLETKSRAVMRDIIKHNGLRMLHNIMKQYRRDFKKIPILRKLLKVLERLAERKILTCDHINSGPPCRGMESFRESMLSLTEHKDKEVHGIARSFRDKWIPRSVRKHGFINRGDCGKSYRNFRHDRFSASLNYPCEQNSRPTKAVDFAHLPLVETSSVNSVVQEVCSATSHNGCEIMGKMGRKRKSRWDEPAETNSVVSSEYNKGKVVSEQLKQDKVFSVPYLNVCELKGQMRRKRKSRWDEAAETNSVVYGKSKEDGMIINAVNVGHNISEDVVPGGSCLFRPLDSSNASQNSGDLALQHPGHSGSRCHSGAVIGHPREKFNSRLPVSYGVPWPIIQQHGTTNLENDCSWATAPGIPFYPFPAPPSYPPQNDCQSYKSTDAMKIDRPAEIVKRESSGLVNCYSDDVNLSTTGLDAKDLSYEDNNHIAKPLEDSPNDLGRS